jgi:hypothetical protein
MQVQFNTPRGIIRSSHTTDEHEWKEAIYNVIGDKTISLSFEDINGDTVILSASLIKESVISFIKTGV